MKRILPVFLLLVIYSFSRAQGPAHALTLKGQVVDSASMMGIAATITLMEGTKMVKVVATGSEGTFALDGKVGMVLRITAVGYRVRDVVASPDIGKILMVAAEVSLQGAVVTA